MPSGKDRVVDARSCIFDLLLGPRPTQSILHSPSVVFDVSDFAMPLPDDCVYVGHGPLGSGWRPSPWGNPFLSASDVTCKADCVDFYEYLESRADVEVWLAPLRNCKLLCHCRNSDCHAHVLAKKIANLFFAEAESYSENSVVHEHPVFIPSGGRDPQVIASAVAACHQPSGNALPTLVPEGLGPEEHLRVALQTAHPFTRPSVLPWPCQHAIANQPRCANECNGHRQLMREAIQHLSRIVACEMEILLCHCHPWLQQCISKRNVPFMREISYITSFCDLALWPDYVLGKPMAGWACRSRSPTVPHKLTEPLVALDCLRMGLHSHNASVLASVGPSGSDKLDEMSWKKTLAEFEEGSLVGPFYSCDAIGSSDVRLVPRRPLWEQHGGAQEPSVRNIDDCLYGGQNDATGMCEFHRPCGLNSWANLIRAQHEAFMHDELEVGDPRGVEYLWFL